MILAPPPVDVQKVATRIVRAVAPVAFHNHPRAVRVTLHCSTRRQLRCTLRVYSEFRLIDRDVLVVRLVRRHRQVVYEDFSGWVSYSRTRSLYLDPA